MFYPTMLSGFSSATETAAETAAKQARKDVELLGHDVDRLLLISEALWMLLKREHGYSDDVLTDLISNIDGRGVKDPPRQCPYCSRPHSGNRPLCIYCGKPLNANPLSR